MIIDDFLYSLKILEKSRAFPLVINGFRANPKDADGHILFFDVEALITQLLTEEYSQMTPGTMEVQGFTTQVRFVSPATIYCQLLYYLRTLCPPRFKFLSLSCASAKAGRPRGECRFKNSSCDFICHV